MAGIALNRVPWGDARNVNSMNSDTCPAVLEFVRPQNQTHERWVVNQTGLRLIDLATESDHVGPDVVEVCHIMVLNCAPFLFERVV